jgi:hypothetical protein
MFRKALLVETPHPLRKAGCFFAALVLEFLYSHSRRNKNAEIRAKKPLYKR